jgi:hypothetical protein
MNALPGIVVLTVGMGLLASPWWSSTLSASDHPLAVVLGIVFSAFGAYVCVPERFGRVRRAVFALAIGTFGLCCTALAFAPFSPDADGTYSIAGIAGFGVAASIPWWARIVAGLFAIVCVGAAALGAWSLVREAVFGARPGD